MKPFSLVLAAAGSLAMVAVAPALAEPARSAHEGVSDEEMVRKFTRVFDRLDRADEGRISRRSIRHMEDRRQHLDGTHIGVIFGGENYRIAFGTDARPRHRGHGYLGPINSLSFHLYDLNDDGYIYRDELRRSVLLEFEYADDYGDGYLNPWELGESDWYYSSHYWDYSGHYPHYRDDYYYPYISLGLGHFFHSDNHRYRHYSAGNRSGHRNKGSHRGGHRDRGGHRNRH